MEHCAFGIETEDFANLNVFYGGQYDIKVDKMDGYVGGLQWISLVVAEEYASGVDLTPELWAWCGKNDE